MENTTEYIDGSMDRGNAGEITEANSNIPTDGSMDRGDAGSTEGWEWFDDYINDTNSSDDNDTEATEEVVETPIMSEDYITTPTIDLDFIDMEIDKSAPTADTTSATEMQVPTAPSTEDEEEEEKSEVVANAITPISVDSSNVSQSLEQAAQEAPMTANPLTDIISDIKEGIKHTENDDVLNNRVSEAKEEARDAIHNSLESGDYKGALAVIDEYKANASDVDISKYQSAEELGEGIRNGEITQDEYIANHKLTEAASELTGIIGADYEIKTEEFNKEVDNLSTLNNQYNNGEIDFDTYYSKAQEISNNLIQIEDRAANNLEVINYLTENNIKSNAEEQERFDNAKNMFVEAEELGNKVIGEYNKIIDDNTSTTEEAPTTETPVEEEEAIEEAPVTETPTTETPVTETPTEETPTTETPTTDAPVPTVTEDEEEGYTDGSQDRATAGGEEQSFANFLLSNAQNNPSAAIRAYADYEYKTSTGTNVSNEQMADVVQAALEDISNKVDALKEADTLKEKFSASIDYIKAVGGLAKDVVSNAKDTKPGLAVAIAKGAVEDVCNILLGTLNLPLAVAKVFGSWAINKMKEAMGTNSGISKDEMNAIIKEAEDNYGFEYDDSITSIDADSPIFDKINSSTSTDKRTYNQGLKASDYNVKVLYKKSPTIRKFIHNIGR